jgi:hypothetical protein
MQQYSTIIVAISPAFSVFDPTVPRLVTQTCKGDVDQVDPIRSATKLVYCNTAPLNAAPLLASGNLRHSFLKAYLSSSFKLSFVL